MRVRGELCSLMALIRNFFPSGVTSFTMTVTLKVHDNQGNVSAVAVNDDVRLLPQGSCGF